MKRFNRYFILSAVIAVLVVCFAFGGASAAEAEKDTYVFTFENTCVSTFGMNTAQSQSVSPYSLVTYSGCYGNQLSGTAKELYDSMVKNYSADKKTGSFEHTFKTPFTFKAEVDSGIITDTPEFVSVKKTIAEAQQMAMDAFLYDCPEVFWFKIMEGTYEITASYDSANGWTGLIKKITIIPTEIYSGASLKASQFESAVDSALSSVTVSESRYDTLKSIHDYICENAWYSKDFSNNRVYTAEPFFVGDKGVVCEGYSKSFKILCDRLGIPCALVSGFAGENHMWNYVQMDDGKWYLVDATWDDQATRIYDTYFIANADTVGFDGKKISEERTVRTDLSGTGIFNFISPVLSDTEYTFHTHEWESDYTVDLEPGCTTSGSKSIHCKLCTETKSATEIAPSGHSWDEGVVTVAATCKKEGVRTYTCINDASHSKKEAVALNPDNHKGSQYIKNQKSSTCTSDGYTGDSYCFDCNKKLSPGKIIPKKAHSFKTTVTKANFTRDGKTVVSCSCGYIKSQKTVYAVKEVKLSAVQYIYNGKEKKPKVTVKDRKGNVLKAGRDYTVIYQKGRKLPGKYTVKINFSDDYNVSVSTSFRIIPSKVSFSKLTTASRSATLTWKAISGVTGYEIEYSTSKSFKNKKKVTVKKSSSKKKTIKKLKKGKKYYFRIRAYKTVDGKRVYGSMSKVRSIKIK